MTPYNVIEPEFMAMVMYNAGLLTLGEGFALAEGPVWFADANQLLVSDLPNDRILRWSDEGGISVFRQPSGFSNGHTRDRQGRLTGCSHQRRCITRLELDGSETVLADRHGDRRLNSPNDVVVTATARSGSPTRIAASTQTMRAASSAELAAHACRLDPTNGELIVVVDEFVGPNGIRFSSDEKRLYIAESGAQFAPDPVKHIRVFNVEDGWRLNEGRVFHKVTPGFADGMRCDEDGRIWTSAGDGVHYLALDGALIGKILTGGVVANLTFRDHNRSRLFLCASYALLAIDTNVRGVQRP